MGSWLLTVCSFYLMGTEERGEPDVQCRREHRNKREQRCFGKDEEKKKKSGNTYAGGVIFLTAVSCMPACSSTMPTSEVVGTSVLLTVLSPASSPSSLKATSHLNALCGCLGSRWQMVIPRQALQWFSNCGRQMVLLGQIVNFFLTQLGFHKLSCYHKGERQYHTTCCGGFTQLQLSFTTTAL